MKDEEIKNLTALLEERTMKLMERESELADKFEELESQKEELTAAVEELIHKNTDLNERNQELDQLLYRASHDLRSPITSMFGILHLLKSDAISESIKDYCQHFERMMHQMNGVVNSLSLLGQSTKETIEISEVDIKPIVEEEISQLSNLPNAPTIKFRKYFSGNGKVHTDEVLLRVLLRCLLSNAITFRERKTGCVEVHIVTLDSKLSLEVIDDGEAISPQVAEKMFDMFYRGSERSIGQGMGLYIVKKIVSRLQGSVNWETRKDKKAFMVSIPLVPVLAS